MKLTKVFDWWPEMKGRHRLWVHESDLPNLHICTLAQQHMPQILDYLHTHSCSYVYSNKQSNTILLHHLSSIY